MFFTGFADEAGAELKTQIAATKELGWHYIESRAIGSKNLASISDAEFEEMQQLLAEADIKVNCFGSGIANWSKDPRKEEDFLASKTELLNAIPRMQKLGTKMLRGMSFLMVPDEEPDSPELEAVIFRKVRELVKICEDAGIVYGHENCMNYGGLSFRHTLKLIEAVNSPNFQLIFDVGNPVFNYRHIGTPPYPLQSSWEFYKNVREFITYVHIKDGTCMVLPDGSKAESVFCYPGDGNADVRAIMIDLLKTGYDGGFSMEPHIATVFHAKEQDTAQASERYSTYVEYGRRFQKLLRECGWKF